MLSRKQKTIYTRKLDELFAEGYYDGGKQNEIHSELLALMPEDEREGQIKKENANLEARQEAKRAAEERRTRQVAEEIRSLTRELEKLVGSFSGDEGSTEMIQAGVHRGYFERSYFSNFMFLLVPHDLTDTDERKLAAASIKWADKQVSYHYRLAIADDLKDAGGLIINEEHTYELILFRCVEGKTIPALIAARPAKDLYAEAIELMTIGQESLDEKIERFDLTQPEAMAFSREIDRLNPKVSIRISMSPGVEETKVAEKTSEELPKTTDYSNTYVPSTPIKKETENKPKPDPAPKPKPEPEPEPPAFQGSESFIRDDYRGYYGGRW